jgi:hypothetical protein
LTHGRCALARKLLDEGVGLIELIARVRCQGIGVCGLADLFVLA